MTALLKLFSVEKLLLYILLALRGITHEQWKFALGTCLHLAEQKLENSERWSSAKALLTGFGLKKSTAQNFVIEAAVSYIEKGLHK